jgi:hypothetical protein
MSRGGYDMKSIFHRGACGPRLTTRTLLGMNTSAFRLKHGRTVFFRNVLALWRGVLT